MVNTFNGEEIDAYRHQLSDLLGRKYVDHSLILGLNNIILSKFRDWILQDISSYYDAVEIDKKDANETAFDTIKLLDILWSEFHYPITKLFQLHHASLFNEVSASFEKSKKNKSQFKVKPVETRKLHEMYAKFVKSIFEFYNQILRILSTGYINPLVPVIFYKAFNFQTVEGALETGDSNFQANIIYLIHKCLLCLGDTSRHRTFIETSYVTPCLSSKAFFDHRSTTGRKDYSNLKLSYERSMNFYHFCIILLPALNEPYNHIGMIYNSLDQKFDACYWFLRSQLTRLVDYELGFNNLISVLKKKWFVTKLVQFGNKDRKDEETSGLEDQLNTMLVCLIGHLILPDTYKNGPIIVKGLKFTSVESQFFELISGNFHLLLNYSEHKKSFFSRQLFMIMGFVSLATSHKSDLKLKDHNSSELLKLTFKYIDKLMQMGSQQIQNSVDVLKYLPLMRLVLNWLKENKSSYKLFRARKSTNEHIATCLNSTISRFSEELTEIIPNFNSLLGQKLKENSRPKRPYYFKEDFNFRDLSIIKYQFKDFNDNHLFEKGNIDLLVGDYSSLNDNGMYHFLVPEALEECNSIFDKNCNLTHFDDVPTRITWFESILTLHAIVLLSKKLVDSNPFGILFDHAKCQYEFIPSSDNTIKKKPVAAIMHSERSASRKPKSRGTKKGDESTKRSSLPENHGEVQNNSVVVPETLKEIESFINQHTSDLQKEIQPERARESQNLENSHIMTSSALEAGISNTDGKPTSNDSEMQSSNLENLPKTNDGLNHPITDRSGNASALFGNYAEMYGQQAFGDQAQGLDGWRVAQVRSPSVSSFVPHYQDVRPTTGVHHPPNPSTETLTNIPHPAPNAYMVPPYTYGLSPNNVQVASHLGVYDIYSAAIPRHYPTYAPQAGSTPKGQPPTNGNQGNMF